MVKRWVAPQDSPSFWLKQGVQRGGVVRRRFAEPKLREGLRQSSMQVADVDEAAGDIQQGIGKGRRKIGEAIKDLGNKIGR